MQESAGSGKPLQVVQFTDTHFFAAEDGRLMGVDTSATFQQVVRLAAKQHASPDFYLLTGDLSQDETEGSYIRFSRAIDGLKAAPAYYLPGNHDSRHHMVKAFSNTNTNFRHEKSFVMGNWQVVLLDTQVPGEVHGHLHEEELEHLEKSLAAHPDLHTLVTLHHHPVPVGSKWIDQISVDNGEELLEVIDNFSHVRGVLCGHIHQQFELQRKSVRFMGSPSTCVQFKPQSGDFALDAMPPGYRWLRLHADGTIESDVARVSAVAAGLDLASAGY